jgi:hypothetical protein
MPPHSAFSIETGSLANFFIWAGLETQISTSHVARIIGIQITAELFVCYNQRE